MSKCDCQSGCCAPENKLQPQVPLPEAEWITGYLQVGERKIPQVATSLSTNDKLGAWAVRLNIGRLDYKVSPGIYAVGSPDDKSPILVSANYKLSFDYLRKELKEINAWILVLDSKGINVWCAAGKGTFSSEEIIKRITESNLTEISCQRKLIIPQLGAPGISAHQVKNESGFSVIYGPVLASDLPKFMRNNCQATPEMRKVHFNLAARLAVIPVEMVLWSGHILLLTALLLLISGLNSHGFKVQLIYPAVLPVTGVVLSAYICGGILVPILLPWLPGKAFSLKGAVLGLIMSSILLLTGILPVFHNAPKMEFAAWTLIISVISAFMAFNFTGTSTFTSISGVKKEYQTAAPVMLTSALLGVGLFTVARFL